MLTLLERECGLAPAWRVADIGSGTGLLARLFLGFGCEVFGVEPNLEMRQAGERELQGQARFHSVSGRAEATGLPDASVDLVTAGQAFHWFDPAGARAEFGRILRAPGWVVLVWNERRPIQGFMVDYEVVQKRFGGERPHPGVAEFDAFFGGGWRMATIPNAQVLDEGILIRRMESCSWAPRVGTEEYEAMMAEMRRLFRVYAREGHIVMEYETRVYWGRV
jgi:SAM-dependent methyltransferase